MELARFERAIMDELSHPNIMTIKDSMEDELNIYLVMDHRVDDLRNILNLSGTALTEDLAK